MKGYSKINTMSNLVESSRHKSRSIDFSSSSSSAADLPDTTSFPDQIPKSNININTTANGDVEQFSSTTTTTKKVHKEEGEEEMDHRNGAVEVTMNGSGNNNVAVLRRNSSVKPTVKRGWSMRRSSSVTDRYSRIYDHSGTLASADEDIQEEEEEAVTTRSGNKKKHIKILKACKRLFGL
ncbi:hypothetical protein CsatB_001598 [Cannabis sativa]